MKYITRILSVFLLASSLAMHGAATQVSPYFSIRSQGEDAARELVGWTNHINLYDVGRFYGTSALTAEYTKSFHSLRIAQCLFGRDLLGNTDNDYNCRSIKISGSGVENRGSKDWLADYFGLPRDYQSTLVFCPRIENFIADFNFYFGLDNFKEGLFFRIHVPVTYTKWDLNFAECINDPGTANHQPGYFNGRVTLGNVQTGGNPVVNAYPNAYGVARSNLVSDFSSYVCNRATPNLGNTQETVMLPDGSNTGLASAEFPPVFFDPLCKARFVTGACDDLSKTGIADLQFALGWNAFQDENYHVGFGLRASAPTGNAPKGEIAFEPIIGNGNHWEFGLLFTSHGTLWKSEDEFQKVGFFFDANVTHLFKTEQQRTFDLKNKPNSRYMLAQKMTGQVSNTLGGSATAGANPPGTVATPLAQFANQFTPLANLTTLCVDVSVGVQADMVFMFAYQRGNFVWDLGYNLWVRSCEKINLDCKCPTPFTDGKTWVLKGDGQVYGYGDPAPQGADPFGQALSASQNSATIHGGTNGYVSLDTTMGGSGGLRPTQNPGIDAPQYAINAQNNAQIFLDNPNTNSVMGSIVGKQIQTSVNPVFIRDCDLDIDGARTKGLSHKIFTHISYTWVDYKEHWDPYLGAGAMGEFHPISSDCEIDCRNSQILSDPCDKSCRRCGLSQWGVWVKGGVSFD